MWLWELPPPDFPDFAIVTFLGPAPGPRQRIRAARMFEDVMFVVCSVRIVARFQLGIGVRASRSEDLTVRPNPKLRYRRMLSIIHNGGSRIWPKAAKVLVNPRVGPAGIAAPLLADRLKRDTPRASHLIRKVASYRRRRQPAKVVRSHLTNDRCYSSGFTGVIRSSSR